MCIYILLFLSVLLSMASAVAPGDEHSFCTDNDYDIIPPLFSGHTRHSWKATEKYIPVTQPVNYNSNNHCYNAHDLT